MSLQAFADAAERSSPKAAVLVIWLFFAAAAGTLLTASHRDYPSLHTALDTAMALLPAILAWLLWDIGRRVDTRLPQLLAVAFAFAALLNLIHVLVALDWPASAALIAQQASHWRPATWPPAAHLLALGTLFALLTSDRRPRSPLPFALALVTLAILLLMLFRQLPRYTPPGLFGITRPFLVTAPLAWALAAGVAFYRRRSDRLMMPVALMAVTLVAANVAMLYSRAPHDTEAMIAHLGRVSGYLVLLLALMQIAASDMQARLRAEAALEQANAQLEARVRERTAELARSNESLLERESHLRAFVSATSDVVYRMSPDWSEMRHLVGQSFIADTTDPSRNWLAKYIHPDDQAQVLATIRDAIRTKEIFELEHRVLRVDGTLGWTFSRAVPLLNERGEITQWLGAASDVTARRQAEEKLQGQLARLSLLGEITRAISERLDVQSIFQVVLRALERQLRVDFACICLSDRAKNCLVVTSVGEHSADLATSLALSERSLLAVDQNGLGQCMRGQLVYESDISHSQFPFPARLAGAGLQALVIAPLIAESEAFGVMVAARRDAASFSSADCEFLRQLTEHLSLATHQAQLYSALQQAYADLRQTQQTVMQQERLRALGQLAGGIAHDINNALSPAALYAQSLLQSEATLSKEARDQLAVIYRAIEDVGSTVARMRLFSRPRDAELTLAPIDLNVLMQQVAELTRARWRDVPQEHGVVIELETDLAPRMPVVMGAQTEVRDALTNLVLNAVDAMPHGGTLTLRSRPERATAVVEISDTGIGMSEAVRSRCLEPFYTTKGDRGTGLGLAMVYGMVQRHSADLEIESEPGRGTTMRLSFQAAHVDEPQPSAAAVRAPDPLRLLLVDDDPLILESMKSVLTGDGHFVSTADGGRNGIDEFLAARARGKPFAMVITDLGMPNVDGRTVAAAIKAASPHTPIMLLTGWGQRLQREDERPQHVDRVLSKPPRLSELRAALAQLVGLLQTPP